MWGRRIVKILIVLIVLGVILHFPSRVKIEVSPGTTVITAPVNPDGTVNYVAALDAEAGEGVTPENNAAIPLLKALGPGMIGQDVRAETFRRLGMPPLAKKGAYFVSWRSWVAGNADESADEQMTKALEAPWAGKDLPAVAGWLSENAAALDKVAAAAKRPRYYVPLVSTSDPPAVLDVLMPQLGSLREAGRALAARALNRAHRGRMDQAWADVLAVFRLGRLLSHRPGLVERLVAVGLEQTAAAAAAGVATSGKLTLAQASAMPADLDALPAAGGIVEAIDHSERFFMLDSFMMMYRGARIDEMQSDGGPAKRGRRPDLDWNLLLRNANAWYDRVVAIYRRAGPGEVRKASEEIGRMVNEVRVRGYSSFKLILYKLLGWPCRKALTQFMGDLLMSLLMPTVGRAVELDVEARTGTDLAKVALALAAHKAEKGSWAKTLSELSPAYLKQVPVDRFTGGPLVYKPTGGEYVLYSVGANGIDDGGRGREDDPQAYDLVVHTPPPTTAPRE